MFCNYFYNLIDLINFILKIIGNLSKKKNYLDMDADPLVAA
jgi:hypothetical protein